MRNSTNNSSARSTRNEVGRNPTAIWLIFPRVRPVSRQACRSDSKTKSKTRWRCWLRKPDQIMPTETEKLTVSVNENDSVTALLYAAAKKERAGLTAVLGHGAGASQDSGFMRMFASGLMSRGLDVMTFNFIYMEQGRSVPDQKPKLESCFRAVIEAIAKHRKLKSNRLVVGGKSMGGRIASQVVAAREAAPLALDVSGLVFLGYPLHPPGN